MRLPAPRLVALALALAPALALAQSDVAPLPEDNASHEEDVPVAARTLAARVDDELEAWDVPAARRSVDELSRELASDPEGLAMLQGKVAFFEGSYAEAVKLFDAAGATSKPGTYRRLAEDALEQTRDDQLHKSAHFDLFLPAGKDQMLAPYALDTLEKAYDALQKDFDFTPPGRIRVEVLPNDEALAKLSTLSVEQIRTTGTIAICKFNRLMIISPRALLHGYDWRDTLNHEFVHLVVSMKSRNTVPIWLHEGLAKYEETRWRGEGGQAATSDTEALLGQAVKHNKLVTFEQMHPSMALLPSAKDAATAFAEVFHAIEFLKLKGGTAMWNAIIANLRDGHSYQVAVADAYHAPFEKFVSDWKAYLAQRRYPSEGGDSRRVEFKSSAAQKQSAIDQTELVDFQDVKNPEARKQAHLGGLLLVRKHPDAASEEFSKAWARDPDSIQLASLYAEALVATHQLDTARKVLTENLKRHPRYELTELELGKVLYEQGDPKSAIEHYLVGIDVDPFDPRLHEGLAEAYEKLGNKEQASQEKLALDIVEARPASKAKDAALVSTVMLASHPYASVSVDGKPLGKTTPTVLQLPAGKHHLALHNEERNLDKQLDLDLLPGEQKELRLELDDTKPDSEPATR